MIGSYKHERTPKTSGPFQNLVEQLSIRDLTMVLLAGSTGPRNPG